MKTIHIVAADRSMIGWNTIVIIHKCSNYIFFSDHLIILCAFFTSSIYATLDAHLIHPDYITLMLSPQ
jgi:hypothetical protein